MQKIIPSFWYDTQGEEAARFYTSIFKNSRILNTTYYGDAGAEVSGQKKGTVMTVEFELEGQKFTALNGGPMFKFTKGTSLFVRCENEKEINELWSKLSQGGKVVWELQKYPWSERYGWCEDKFGLSWQLILGGGGKQKIVPPFLFSDDLLGKGEEAIKFYTSQFPNSKVESLQRDPQKNTVMHSVFSLNGNEFVLMEGQGPEKIEITHAISFEVHCDTQKDIDEFWDKLVQGGGAHEECGWLHDKFGVPWQIVPAKINEWMAIKDPVKTEKVLKVMFKMKKLDIQKLQDALR